GPTPLTMRQVRSTAIHRLTFFTRRSAKTPIANTAVSSSKQPEQPLPPASVRRAIVFADDEPFPRTDQPPHVRLTLTYIQRQYGIAVDARLLNGRYRRFCGDAGTPGRGEILEWVAS